MKKRLRKLYCWIFGHCYMDAAFGHQEWFCERCEVNTHIDRDRWRDAEPWSLPMFWSATVGLWLWRFQQWRNERKRLRFFQKHRHDHLDDDIPF